MLLQSQSQSHIATDGQSVSQYVLVLSPILGFWPVLPHSVGALLKNELADTSLSLPSGPKYGDSR
jgi:hypothetical protein